MAPRSATAMTARAPPRPWAVSVVPSMGSTAMSVSGGVPSPIFSPLKSIGALSFSPSPMTTIPSIGTLERTVRIASTAAPSAPSLSPPPIHPLAASAAASVTRTRSMARFRSGAWRDVTTGPDHSCSRIAGCRSGTPPAAILEAVDEIVVQPNGPLRGTVSAGGAKNSALKLMAACLLAEGRTVLSNVPRISDVDTMSEVLRGIGARVERLDNGDVSVTTPAEGELVPSGPYELFERMRASVVVLGLLLARCGSVRVPLPGGDDFGDRPINFHLSGLTAMGARFESSHGEVRGMVPGGRLVGTRVVLEYPSHTATDNLLMAAVLAKGTTVIENAAKEPEVADLASMLRDMGAVVRGAGTSRIEIEGVESLRPARHAVVADRVVAATYLAAVGMAGGEVTIADARPEHMEMLLRKVEQMGVSTDMGPHGLRAGAQERLLAADVATLPYPGVATDYSPLLVAMLTVSDGVGILTENLFSGRFRYVEELRRMGADIRTEGHPAVVRGVPRLSGARVRAPDIRAGVALVLAGLVADGETTVTGAHHIGRGYQDLVGDLRALGAEVTSS